MTRENPDRPSRRLALVLLPLVLLAALLLTGAGCTPPAQLDQPASDEQAAAAAPTPVAAPPAAPAVDDAPSVRDTHPPRQAPPMSDPLPPVRAPERDAGRSPTPAPVEVPAGAPVRIDTSCTRDADCVVKNVGNCCGYYPACVNVDSPTDPAAVQAQCARSGEMSVCGFPSISACQCVAGTCQGGGSAAVER